jgi:hypothetical protein
MPITKRASKSNRMATMCYHSMNVCVYIMPNYVNSHFAFDKNRRIVGEGISFC